MFLRFWLSIEMLWKPEIYKKHEIYKMYGLSMHFICTLTKTYNHIETHVSIVKVVSWKYLGTRHFNFILFSLWSDNLMHSWWVVTICGIQIIRRVMCQFTCFMVVTIFGISYHKTCHNCVKLPAFRQSLQFVGDHHDALSVDSYP